MAKIFAVFVAGFVLLRGLILLTDPVWLSLLGLGLVIVLTMIWASGWIARRLPGYTAPEEDITSPDSAPDSVTELPETDPDSEPESDSEAEPEAEVIVPPEGMSIAIAGWAVLMILLALVLFMGPEEEPALLEGHLPACDEAA